MAYLCVILNKLLIFAGIRTLSLHEMNGPNNHGLNSTLSSYIQFDPKPLNPSKERANNGKCPRL